MLNISITDIFSVIIAACKDYEQKICLEKLRSECIEYALAEADSRRAKTSQIILTMANLKLKLQTLQFEFQRFFCKYKQPFPTLEKLIKDLETEYNKLAEKKHA